MVRLSFLRLLFMIILSVDLTKPCRALNIHNDCAMDIHPELVVLTKREDILSRSKLNSEFECRKSCCNMDGCRGYTWLVNQLQCSMFSCMDKNSSCSLAANMDGRVGLLEGYFSLTEHLKVGDILRSSALDGDQRSSMKTSDITKDTSSAGGLERTEAAGVNKDLMGLKSSIFDLGGHNFDHEKESFKRETEFAKATKDHKVIIQAPGSVPANAAHEVVPKELPTQGTTPRVVSKHHKKISNVKGNSSQTALVASLSDPRHVHTTQTSLIVALFFGLTFSVVVVIVVSHRWWESTTPFRSGYHRVEYLLNGNLRN